ncbi:hypothetical protein BCV70DRAFT_197855 [Testicularia cyperi]|uniref:BRCT domain-containing protein n=1 Tax=Testicularia cyperi TaxID=1882483 RepID=A0A317XZD8_9BASI|nr:hypothetical protein BCV70DRAFT_197855 [Testicularia cyperi]
MSHVSPSKRRAGSVRSVADQPMRQTRSMARISDATDFPEQLWSARQTREAQNSSPQRRVEHFGSDSPKVRLTAQMESPKKGRFDDFEFELENSISEEVPTRRRRLFDNRSRLDTNELRKLELQSGSVTDKAEQPSCSTGLDNARSSISALSSSRKENTGESARIASPSKAEHVPRVSRLTATSKEAPFHAPLSKASLASSEDFRVKSESRSDSRAVPAHSQSCVEDVLPASSTNRRLLFPGSHSVMPASDRGSPFIERSEIDSLAKLGEPRHSPIKRMHVKSEFLLQSPDRPDRKPINLLELKPSPGKAQRGIFRHDVPSDDEAEPAEILEPIGPQHQDTSDYTEQDAEEVEQTQDEIRLVARRSPSVQPESKAVQPAIPSRKGSSSTPAAHPATQGADGKATSSSGSTRIDVRRSLSAETSDALASLEASLAKLTAKTQKRKSLLPATKTESQPEASKRTLGETRPTVSSIPVRRSQALVSRASTSDAAPSMASARPSSSIPASATLADFSSLSAASLSGDKSADDSMFKRPSGRVSALSKARQSSQEQRVPTSNFLKSSRSEMNLGRSAAPVEAANKADNTSQPATDDGLAIAPAAADADADAEAKRKADLKAARRKSMHSILSFGMPPPLVRDQTATASSDSTTTTKEQQARDVSSTIKPKTEEGEEEASAEARKAAKAARRRSLYTYVPAKREDADLGDRSTGNVSMGIVIGATGGAVNGTAKGEVSDSTMAPPKRTRFLRGLTVLVDVRDQDGEDASACWVEMLKTAGAKVMVRFGERKLTHIVYKSGRPSTLHSYRALADPKPHVVGISWVVKCLEQGIKVDEEPYLVEVAKQAIFTQVSCNLA